MLICKNCPKSIPKDNHYRKVFCSTPCYYENHKKNWIGNGRDMTRERVRVRDKHTCQAKNCEKVWVKGERRFDVHHRKGLCGKKSKGYDKLEDMPFLITYCHKCHLNLHIVKKKMIEAWVKRKLAM